MITKLVDYTYGNVSEIYNDDVTLSSESCIKGKFKGNGRVSMVFRGENDLIQSAEETIEWSGFDVSKIKDHDDSTYAQLPANIPATTTRVLVKYDLGNNDYHHIYA